MRTLVLVFPGSNCDRDAAMAVEAVGGRPATMVWHKETILPAADLIVVPGGFSYGDYLRSGAMAARSPIMPALAKAAAAGVPTLGICNGFQILTEAGLLPGALGRNRNLKFIARAVDLTVSSDRGPFLSGYSVGQAVRFPVAHHDGRYIADPDTLDRLEGDGLVAFRYTAPPDAGDRGWTVNGSAREIAGIVDPTGRILGLMPHPERAVDPALDSGTDGRALFAGLIEGIAA